MKTYFLLSFLVPLVPVAAQVYQGFNFGAALSTNNAKQQSDFETEFNTSKALENTPGYFNSARLFTCIQFGTVDTLSSAFPAAIATNTSILIGIWASGTNNITNEITALGNALTQYGNDLLRLIVGISVGSEDLYRVSESGIRNNAGIGQDAETIVRFIRTVRAAANGTALSDIPIGHVDSWSAWVNESNSAVIDAVDFVGVDIYPYYEDDQDNTIENAATIFNDLYNRTATAAGSTPVWVTETGWPHSGPKFGNAEASVQNAQTYWDEIGCSLYGRTNTWWFTLQDDNTGADAQFGVTEDNSVSPRLNLTCAADSGAPATVNINTNPDTNSAPHGSKLPATLLVFISLVGEVLFVF